MEVEVSKEEIMELAIEVFVDRLEEKPDAEEMARKALEVASECTEDPKAVKEWAENILINSYSELAWAGAEWAKECEDAIKLVSKLEEPEPVTVTLCDVIDDSDIEAMIEALTEWTWDHIAEEWTKELKERLIDELGGDKGSDVFYAYLGEDPHLDPETEEVIERIEEKKNEILNRIKEIAEEIVREKVSKLDIELPEIAAKLVDPTDVSELVVVKVIRRVKGEEIIRKTLEELNVR